MASLPAEINESYAKLARVNNSFLEDRRVLANALKKNGDINHKIPSTSCLRLTQPDLIGCTLLHVAAMRNDKAIFDILLANGADFTVQNYQGRTVLHFVLDKREWIDAVLSLHLSLKDPRNPRDKDGLSHLHIACAHNRVDVVEFFLNAGSVEIDAAVSLVAEKYAGYTPLHFAAEGLFLPLLSLLLKHEANASVKDPRGLTPFHFVLEAKLKMLESDDQNNELAMADIDEAANKLMTMDEDFGLTHFHVACTQRDEAMVEYYLEQNVDIDQQVRMDSPIFPGYTALHFAAHCKIAKIARILLRRGANFRVKDARGVTPLDLFWKFTRRQDLESLFVAMNLHYLMLSDGQTRLLDFVRFSWAPETCENYLLNVEDFEARIMDSAVAPECWLGRTLLHFAVLLHKSRQAVDICLTRGFGSQVNARDNNDSTPVHLAFHAGKFDVVATLLERCRDNLVDSDGLSYLYIACAFGRAEFVERFYEEADISVVYRGKSVLEAALANEEPSIVETFLNRSLDMEGRAREDATIVSALQDLGHTRLHVAIYFDLDEGPFVCPDTVDAIVNCSDASSIFHPYRGCTPLQLALRRGAPTRTLELLVEAGADLLLALYDALTLRPDWTSSVVNKLRDDDDTRTRFASMSGITMLHLACHTVNVEAAKWLLIGGSDANARAKTDCPVWPGCTPLHLLMKAIAERRGVGDEIEGILAKLLANGADVAAVDAKGETPIHLAMRDAKDQRVYTVVKLLVDHLRVHDVNPVDGYGVSHFHAACLASNSALVKRFLANGADVARPVDFFAASCFAGETPLHLALEHDYAEELVSSECRRETVEALLSRGADVHAQDVRGETPLFKAVRLRDCLEILEKFAERGAAANPRNIFEQTPLELLLQSEHLGVEKLEFFKEHGCRLNVGNPLTEVGYLSLLVSRKPREDRPEYAAMASITSQLTRYFEGLLRTRDARLPDSRGRGLLHNIVTTNDPYCEAFTYDELVRDFLSALGVDVDLQDKTGKTALHLAAKFGNRQAVTALLNHGADVNVLDESGKVALTYALDHHEDEKYCKGGCHLRIIRELISHICRLEILNLEVSAANDAEKSRAISEHPSIARIYNAARGRLPSEIIGATGDVVVVDLQPQLLVRDFLSETGRGLTSYSFTTDLRREKVDEFFREYDGDLRDLCALQYKKTLRRVALVEPALDSVWAVAGTAVPIDCIELIFQHLSNCDLENLARAVDAVENVA